MDYLNADDRSMHPSVCVSMGRKTREAPDGACARSRTHSLTHSRRPQPIQSGRQAGRQAVTTNWILLEQEHIRMGCMGAWAGATGQRVDKNKKTTSGKRTN
eukprot:GHVU01065084.1.p2 GENE.GHVU01065084.1~~GHVU01065084.1.p2  ORF type:complete len:101 (-),score=9.40 GHVU01065084.1:576-878(-)